jgi:CDP-6-deoxy-D-xylo-4-hexulose-3-dehydrase
MSTPYRLAADTFRTEEIEAAKKVLDSGLLTMGERVRTFEGEFAAWVGSRHALMVNSGSSANLLMVDALVRRAEGKAPLAPGDEVLVPGLSWPTTVWPLVQLGLVPVFVDVDPVTLAIDLESARKVLGPRTKAMFLIQVLGRVPDMASYQKFCAEHGLQLLEDTCESLGAHWNGRHAGTFGLFGSFSFYFSHHISTIEGGMVVTDDPALDDELRGLRAHGWSRNRADKARWKERYPDFDERFLFISAGYNVRPMELQGAIGSVQLRRLDEMLDAREQLARKVLGWLGASARGAGFVQPSELPGLESPHEGEVSGYDVSFDDLPKDMPAARAKPELDNRLSMADAEGETERDDIARRKHAAEIEPDRVEMERLRR